MLSVRFKYQEDVKQAYVPSSITYQQLLHIVSDLFELPAAAIRLSYESPYIGQDTDGDRIVFSSDIELKEGLSSTNKNLLIFVERAAASEPELVVHAAICDHCEEQIIGIRYKCTTCPDFDLCEECEQSGQNHDPTHLFLKIRRPLPYPGGLPGPFGRPVPLLPNLYEVPRWFCFRGCFGPFRRACQPCSPAAASKSCRPCEVKCEAAKCAVKCSTSKCCGPCETKSEASSDMKLEKPADLKEKGRAAEQEQVKQEKDEKEKERHPFEAKLAQLEEMGFHDRARNIDALVRNSGNVSGTVRDLLGF